MEQRVAVLEEQVKIATKSFERLETSIEKLGDTVAAAGRDNVASANTSKWLSITTLLGIIVFLVEQILTKGH
jgi:hypothetical protein